MSLSSRSSIGGVSFFAKIVVPAIVFMVSAALAAGACSSPERPAGIAVADTTAPVSRPASNQVDPGGAVRVTATATVAGAELVIEAVHAGDRATASYRTPAGLVAQEVLVGTDLYQHTIGSEPVLGTDAWVHIDLSDPAQADAVEGRTLGLLGVIALVDAEIGDEFSGRSITAIAVHDDATRIIDLDGAGRFVVRHHRLDEPPAIDAPTDVVELTDLPGLAGLTSLVPGR